MNDTESVQLSAGEQTKRAKESADDSIQLSINTDKVMSQMQVPLHAAFLMQPLSRSHNTHSAQNAQIKGQKQSVQTFGEKRSFICSWDKRCSSQDDASGNQTPNLYQTNSSLERHDLIDMNPET